MSKHTCDNCSVTWDRKMNLKDIVLCPFHTAAPDLLAAREKFTVNDLSDERVRYGLLIGARAAIARAK